MTRVLTLSDPRATDVGLSGVRMAWMARIATAGIAVPPGFVVTTECGEWADPEAEAAVFRGYDSLGDGRGNLPVVEVRSSPAAEGLPAPAGGSLETARGIGTLPELFAAIDTCRGRACVDAGRPYYPGLPATFMAVGVFRTLPAEVSGVAFTRCPSGPGRSDVESADGRVLDESPLELVRETVRRISELLRADVGVEWAVVDGELVVLGVRALEAWPHPSGSRSAAAGAPANGATPGVPS